MQEELQNAFVRLCCDQSYRRTFLAEGASALSDYRLSENECVALQSIVPAELERYARGLLTKRWRELATVIPLSETLSPSLGKRYQAWLKRCPSESTDSVLSPGQSEGLRALSHLHAQLSQPSESPYLAGILAYEILASCSHTDREVRFLKSDYALHTLIPAMRREEFSLEAKSAPHHYRFHERGVQWRAIK